MVLYASGEDYLEAILVLQRKMGAVRSVDLARHMNFSKPSISNAVGLLKKGGFLEVDGNGSLLLTGLSREVAEQIYERHQFFTRQLIAAGVDEKLAEEDACKIEHAISEESFRKLEGGVGGIKRDCTSKSFSLVQSYLLLEPYPARTRAVFIWYLPFGTT